MRNFAIQSQRQTFGTGSAPLLAATRQAVDLLEA